MRTSLVGFLTLIIATFLSGRGAAQSAAPQTGDPANGKAVFAFGNTSCTNCHGLEGQGGWGPDLAGRRITYDQAIAAIRNPTWRMPAFVPSQLSDKEILERTQGLLEQGAAGIVYGRNVIQHPKPKGITQALMAMVHDGASVKKALSLIK